MLLEIVLFGFLILFFNLLLLVYINWNRQWQPTPVLLPGESHGGRSLVGYSPWGRKELDTTERLHFHLAYVLNVHNKTNREESEASNLCSCTRPYNLRCPDL